MEAKGPRRPARGACAGLALCVALLAGLFAPLSLAQAGDARPDVGETPTADGAGLQWRTPPKKRRTPAERPSTTGAASDRAHPPAAAATLGFVPHEPERVPDAVDSRAPRKLPAGVSSASPAPKIDAQPAPKRRESPRRATPQKAEIEPVVYNEPSPRERNRDEAPRDPPLPGRKARRSRRAAPAVAPLRRERENPAPALLEPATRPAPSPATGIDEPLRARPISARVAGKTTRSSANRSPAPQRQAQQAARRAARRAAPAVRLVRLPSQATVDSADQPATAEGVDAPPIDCNAGGGFKKISDLTGSIAVAGEDIPDECPLADDSHAPRDWARTKFTWKASSLCHKPLYFEDPQLERYGHSVGVGPLLQPIVSGAKFFAAVPLLPYKMGMDPPLECQYSLGWYRPGNCAPWVIMPPPISLRGVAAQGAAVTGAFYIFP